ncbi:MAG: hypothetical protein JO069_19590 [Verrucomicrobia bacterium]|nr:hypothetical protein [Verrucomicrobiota bacterium]
MKSMMLLTGLAMWVVVTICSCTKSPTGPSPQSHPEDAESGSRSPASSPPGASPQQGK